MTTTPNAIGVQNDQFRREGPTRAIPGWWMSTAGIAALPEAHRVAISTQVRDFEAFDHANDGHGEHDFGAFDVAGVGKALWKIDYYADGRLREGAEDPLKSVRVLTVMLASEY